MGYQTSNFIVETGTLFILIIAFIGASALTMLLKLNLNSPRLIQKLQKYLEKMLFFNGILRLLLESYMVLALSSIINIL